MSHSIQTLLNYHLDQKGRLIAIQTGDVQQIAYQYLRLASDPFQPLDCTWSVRLSLDYLKLCLNLLKRETSAKVGIKAKRLKAGWDMNYLFKVLSV